MYYLNLYLNILQLIQSDTASDKGLTEINVKDPDNPMIRREFKITVTITGKWILKPNSETGKRAGGTETTTSRTNSGNSFIFEFTVCSILHNLSNIFILFYIFNKRLSITYTIDS
jgi:hypothetical protein